MSTTSAETIAKRKNNALAKSAPLFAAMDALDEVGQVITPEMVEARRAKYDQETALQKAEREAKDAKDRKRTAELRELCSTILNEETLQRFDDYVRRVYPSEEQSPHYAMEFWRKMCLQLNLPAFNEQERHLVPVKSNMPAPISYGKKGKKK